MSVSIYYTAQRSRPLTSRERTAVDKLIVKDSIRDHVEQHIRTGQGHNGMNFYVYDAERPSEPDLVFEGSTQLPSNDDDALSELVQHWCRLLSAIRHLIPGADWHVHVDDQDIAWDTEREAYDPEA